VVLKRLVRKPNLNKPLSREVLLKGKAQYS
jgi:hypothetical protein